MRRVRAGKLVRTRVARGLFQCQCERPRGNAVRRYSSKHGATSCELGAKLTGKAYIGRAISGQRGGGSRCRCSERPGT